MLLNGTHLLPDGTGATIWPRRRLLAAADPLPAAPGRDGGPAAAVVKVLAALLRRRSPATVVWLGTGLAAALAAGRLDRRWAAELTRLAEASDWVWVGDDLPPGLPGRSVAEWTLGPLTFRAAASPAAGPGEVAASPAPSACLRHGDDGGAPAPCYLVDGRRLLLPPFGPRPGRADALSPEVLALYRRPFQALLLLPGGRLLARPRAALRPAPGPGPAGPR